MDTIPLSWWVPLVSYITPGCHVVELGCGYGKIASNLAKAGMGLHLTLIDFSMDILCNVHELIQNGRYPADRGTTFELLCGDVLKMDLPKCDVVYSSGLFEHFEHEGQVRMLEKCAESARTVITIVPNKKCQAYMSWMETRIQNNDWPYGREVPEESLKALYAEAGLEVLAERSIGYESFCDPNGEAYLLMTVGRRP